MRIRFSFVLMVLVGAMVCFTGFNLFAGQHVVYAVWAQPAEKQTTTLRYAHTVDGLWTQPVKLPLSEGLHVTPVIAVDKKNGIWIIWVEQTAAENILRYAVIRHGKTETRRVLHAGNEQNYAPAIMIDNDDTPWIAWSSVVEKFADIYSSRWNGSGWEKALRVNQKNNTPDITPILGLQNKEIPWVTWFGFNEKRRYVQFFAKWYDERWRVDKKTLPSIEVKNFVQQKIGIELQFPEHAQQKLMGALFVESGKEIQSISDRFLSTQMSGRN